MKTLASWWVIFKFVDLPFEPEFDGFRSGYRRKSRHSRPTHPCLFHWRASIFRKYLLLSILWSAKFVPPTRLPSASDVVTHQKGTLKWGYTNISLIEFGPYFTAFWRVYRWNMLELFLQSQSVFAPLRFLPFGSAPEDARPPSREPRMRFDVSRSLDRRLPLRSGGQARRKKPGGPSGARRRPTRGSGEGSGGRVAPKTAGGILN